MVVWPNDTKFSRVESRSSAIVSKIMMSSHTGTHVDAPKHFLFESSGVDRLPLQKLVGPARVVGSRAQSLISLAEVKKFKPQRGDKILFKTRNSSLLKQKKFTADYVSLSFEAARYLASKKIDLVGIDYYGIESKSAPGHPVHKELLRTGIVVVEGLDLGKVKPGRYNLVILPLKLIGGDGSPARAILYT